MKVELRFHASGEEGAGQWESVLSAGESIYPLRLTPLASPRQ